ncbi:MAG: tetratricopeptide repeat protein [Candidatus Aphodousia sp.]|nr:tetratricopeptide repeat protein [Sutterella sp.]MDY2899246.1 tetratricopeptide repeat protein [Candidatus Aphodousia sp.]
MAYDLQEQESLDELKAWWEKWGNIVLTAITVVCLAFAGYNGMKWYERHQAGKASQAFASLQTAIADQAATESVVRIVDALIDDGGSTAYAPMGALSAARYLEMKGDRAKAQELLHWVVTESDNAEFQTVARVRLSGFMLDDNRYEEAVTLLTQAQPAEREIAVVKDRLGDAYFAKGDLVNARAAWQEALKHPVDAALMGFVQLKLQALPEDKAAAQ